jgi:hypothetical protein
MPSKLSKITKIYIYLMTTMGKVVTPSMIKSRNYNGKQNKLDFLIIHIEGIKVATFQQASIF